MKKLLSIVYSNIKIRSFRMSSCSMCIYCPPPTYGPTETQRSEMMNGIKILAAKTSGTIMASCTIMFQVSLSLTDLKKEKVFDLRVCFFVCLFVRIRHCGLSGGIRRRSIFCSYVSHFLHTLLNMATASQVQQPICPHRAGVYIEF